MISMCRGRGSYRYTSSPSPRSPRRSLPHTLIDHELVNLVRISRSYSHLPTTLVHRGTQQTSSSLHVRVSTECCPCPSSAQHRPDLTHTTLPPPPPSQPTRRPCLACKQSKVKCTYTSPCLRCVKRSIPCLLPADTSDGRLRRYHRRSTLGCGACKARHVRCDEGRPVCGNCRVRVEQVGWKGGVESASRD